MFIRYLLATLVLAVSYGVPGSASEVPAPAQGQPNGDEDAQDFTITPHILNIPPSFDLKRTSEIWVTNAKLYGFTDAGDYLRFYDHQGNDITVLPATPHDPEKVRNRVKLVSQKDDAGTLKVIVILGRDIDPGLMQMHFSRKQIHPASMAVAAQKKANEPTPPKPKPDF